MKTVIIIDDEPLARQVIKEMLKDFPEVHILDECANGFEGLKSIEKHHPDLIFLDVQMPKINGFEMLELVDNQPRTIFTTAFDEYALKAFDANALDYLLKPFTKERFKKAMEKILDETSTKEVDINNLKSNNEYSGRIVIKDGSEIKIIPTSSVNYLEAYDDYVKIHTDNKTYLKKTTMSHYQENLDPSDFIRVHRSFIINVNRLTKIEGFEKNSYRAILKCGARIPVSRSSYTDLKKSLGL